MTTATVFRTQKMCASSRCSSSSSSLVFKERGTHTQSVDGAVLRSVNCAETWPTAVAGRPCQQQRRALSVNISPLVGDRGFRGELNALVTVHTHNPRSRAVWTEQSWTRPGFTGRKDGPWTRVSENDARVHGPCIHRVKWQSMVTIRSPFCRYNLA